MARVGAIILATNQTLQAMHYVTCVHQPSIKLKYGYFEKNTENAQAESQNINNYHHDSKQEKRLLVHYNYSYTTES